MGRSGSPVCGRTALPLASRGAPADPEPQEPMGEANFPAKSTQAVQEARVSPPHVHSGGTSHPQSPPPQGTSSPVRLIGPVHDRATFAAFGRSRRRVRSGCLTVTLVPGATAEPARVAYAISHRFGGAVQRNRLRRRLRAVMTELISQVESGAYLVSVGRPAPGATYQELKAMMSTALCDLARSDGAGSDRRPAATTPGDGSGGRRR